MFKKTPLLLSILVISLLSATAMLSFAANTAFDEDRTKEKQQIIEKLEGLFQQAPNFELEESAMSGVYQFWAGSSLNFVTYNEGHIMLGEVYDTKRNVSLAGLAKSARTKKVIDSIDSKKMIIYGPDNPKRVVNVFTDIDCGFCRKLHTEVPVLNKAGIQVRYLAFPRGYSTNGENDASYQKYVSVWCSDDRHAAMDASKSGQTIENRTCETPIAETHGLGIKLGLRGTPFIIYDDGSIEERGYIPANAMIQKLGLSG